jgi:hypothetical protein
VSIRHAELGIENLVNFYCVVLNIRLVCSIRSPTNMARRLTEVRKQGKGIAAWAAGDGNIA